ncbi:putative ADP-heptose--lipooligosaccharide heptosyltransferase I [Xenorhabdus mauleonii]|uniref:ADP-heptose--lipooligosaccharide heptosyltransferase I n=1 Tax=Xenorhabdus mauleonii TaxID=351675 RepID=A0A1I3JDW2_9GAMM|nr:glycosyltransferase family 9 protein [Xenorhabdus mauleonii]PHM46178.1 putative ADP-heptose--lipooligosaccharide heptosyltransferase I [Xenorhabdus mauleonii]SFI58336.1 ADP-heptose:LPS heptosyltransferase [Xenorhabdus mauleonii]
MKIAILRRNGLGDLVCTQPLIKFLQKKYPGAEINLFINPDNIELAHYLAPDININIIPKGNKYLSILKTALKFRQKKFDIAISAKPTPMKLNNLFLWLLGAKKRYAVVSESQWHSKLINQPVSKKQVNGYHQALKVLRIFSSNETELSPSLLPSITLDKKNHNSSINSPTVLFSVSNNRKNSLINNERLDLIAQKILIRYPKAEFIISSLNKDVFLAEDLKSRIGKNCKIVISSSLESFLTLLNDMTLIVVGDGGICHLAAALQKKLVALYGVTTPKNWAPLANKNNCITLYDPENVNNIELDKIYNSIFSLLEKSNIN